MAASVSILLPIFKEGAKNIVFLALRHASHQMDTFM